MKYPPRRPGGWLRAPVKKCVYLRADGTLSVLRNAPCRSRAVVISQRIEKRPCGIVAQKIFFVRKSSREKFSRFSFGTLSIIAVKYREYNCRERGATRRESEEKFASHEHDALANPAKVFRRDPSQSKSADRKEPLHFQSQADLAWHRSQLRFCPKARPSFILVVCPYTVEPTRSTDFSCRSVHSNPTGASGARSTASACA